MEKFNSLIYVLNVQNLPLEDVSVLSDTEKERFSRFRKGEDKVLFLGGRLLIRHFVGKEEILLQENKKPYIEGGRHFSITHSYPYVALAVDEVPIGIDIESIERLNSTPVTRYFPEEDKQEYPDLAFLWCLKEAAYKADGTGYFQPSERLIKTGDDSFLYRNKEYHYQKEVLDGFLLVLVSPLDKKWDVHLVTAEEITRLKP